MLRDKVLNNKFMNIPIDDNSINPMYLDQNCFLKSLQFIVPFYIHQLYVTWSTLDTKAAECVSVSSDYWKKDSPHPPVLDAYSRLG